MSLSHFHRAHLNECILVGHNAETFISKHYFVLRIFKKTAASVALAALLLIKLVTLCCALHCSFHEVNELSHLRRASVKSSIDQTLPPLWDQRRKILLDRPLLHLSSSFIPDPLLLSSSLLSFPLPSVSSSSSATHQLPSPY